jgi:hypothetical protein
MRQGIELARIHPSYGYPHAVSGLKHLPHLFLVGIMAHEDDFKTSPARIQRSENGLASFDV